MNKKEYFKKLKNLYKLVSLLKDKKNFTFGYKENLELQNKIELYENNIKKLKDKNDFIENLKETMKKERIR